MSGQTAQQAHLLASRIQTARIAGDHETADRLIKEFNEKVFAPAQPKQPVAPTSQNQSAGNTPTNADSQLDSIQNQLVELTSQYRDLVQAKQQQVDTGSLNTNQPSAQNQPDAIPSLAQVVKEMQNTQANPVPLETGQPPVNLPTDQVNNLPNSPQVSEPNSIPVAPLAPTPPAAPDFKQLISNYHEGVQALLKQYLADFSKELETPEAVLGELLVREFESLWRDRQAQEPLLLKLPEYIQQRSVLLRFADNLKNRLS